MSRLSKLFPTLLFVLAFGITAQASMLIQQLPGYDGGVNAIAAGSYIRIEPGGGGATFAYCANVGVVNPPATSAGNCRLFTNANLTILYMSPTRIDAILPAGYGDKTVTLEYFDEGDNYWYFYNSQSLTVRDLAPHWLNYQVSTSYFLSGLLYATQDGSNYFYYKNFADPQTSLGFSVSYNAGTSFFYPTIAVLYYTGGDSNTQFLINGTVNTSRIVYHGASGYQGIRQINFYADGLGTTPNFKVKNTNSVYTGSCGVGCEESFAMNIENYVQ